MNAPEQVLADTSPIHWQRGADSRVPYRVYTDAELYKRELERFV